MYSATSRSTPLKTLSSPALITDHLWNQVRSIRLVEAHLRLFIFLRIDTHTSGINSSHYINSKFASDPIQLVSMSIEGARLYSYIEVESLLHSPTLGTTFGDGNAPAPRIKNQLANGAQVDP
jgi:hypothetical protein